VSVPAGKPAEEKEQAMRIIKRDLGWWPLPFSLRPASEREIEIWRKEGKGGRAIALEIAGG